MRLGSLAVFLLFLLPLCAHAQSAPALSRKLPGLAAFPIGVWCQDPKNVAAYKDIGINVYVDLWQGGTEKQFAALQKAGMKAVCEQNPESIKPAWKDTVLAFMHGDEPDNAQELPGKKGWGPPILPAKLVEDYKKLKAADPRPVLLNLGQGVAWDGWFGRGTRTNHPEDYAEYAQGCDLASFDIYPVCHPQKEVAGKLEFVGRGVERLRTAAAPRPVWVCIETTHISNPERKATPDQVRSEVFMAIANGATGIIYFAHEFKPKFIEASLLADKEMAAAVKKINAEVQAIGPALLEGEGAPEINIESAEKDAIKWIARRWKNGSCVVVSNMTDQRRKFGVTVPAGKKIESLPAEPVKRAGNRWQEEIPPYGVRLWMLHE